MKSGNRMMNRRHFLSQTLTHTCSLGLASATLSSSLFSLGMARQAAANSLGDYRALVCILLAGGNDSFNMVVPNDNDQFAEYSAIRSDLALDQATLLPLAGNASNGRRYALHPGMPEVQQLYADGELAIMANIGTLLEPVDAQAVENGTASLPLGLFSHADQIAQWQTGIANGRNAQGWGGRMADLFDGVNLANGISMNISLAGSNIYQSGNLTTEYSISAEGNGADGLNAYGDGSDFGLFRKRMVDGLLGVNHNHVLRREYAQRLRSAIDSQNVFVAALDSAITPSTPFSASPFSRSLAQIARVISARDALGACRQTFFVQVGGWDHHDDVLNNQARMLPMISKGLGEFRDALIELGVYPEVTTFTTSDFGRTLTSNGKGSDHGWGGHHLVMGGSVQGQRMIGDYPELSASSPLDVGRGIYVPTTAVDLYFAELAQWFGVADTDLALVLPNIRNFYAAGSTSPPLGFMS